jgi:hypothetical protein
MSTPSNDRGLFVVDLRGLDLPPEAATAIGTAIRRAALLELAGLDLTGSLTMSYRSPGSADFDAGPLGEEWPIGLWIDTSAESGDV